MEDELDAILKHSDLATACLTLPHLASTPYSRLSACTLATRVYYGLGVD